MPSNKAKGRVSSSIFNQLAAKNVRKSAKDYFIYFFTLTLAVALFYSFNSISTQFASLQLEDRLNYLAFSSSMLTAVSVLVCFIMGALVIYANRFLLRRRKKEMGIYATLGMERKDLNRLLMRETLRIGVISLVAGLILGVFGAQALSLLTAKLTSISVSSYTFMISPKAIILSVVFFALLFLFVHIFNVKELKKMSLLEMLYADRKNEAVSGKKGAANILVMILGLIVMAGGYVTIFIMSGNDLFRAIGAGGGLLIIGTILFFISVFKAMPKIMAKNKRTYFRGLNMFTTGQFSSKVKTEGRSGAMIAILLFLALVLTAIGPGTGKYVMNGIENADPYDATIYYVPWGQENPTDNPEKALEKGGFEISNFSNSEQAFWTYSDDSLTGRFLTENQGDSKEQTLKKNDENDMLTIIGLEDYNNLMKLQGEKTITLGDDEFALSYSFPAMGKTMETFSKNPQPLKLNGMSLSLAKEGVSHTSWENKNALVETGTVIVPQEMTKGLDADRWVVNFNFMKGIENPSDALYEEWNTSNVEGFQLMAGHEVIVSITADNLLTTYLGIYLGITFLITAGAVLALQHLSQSSDNVKRYDLLRKLGASGKDMRRSLKKQLRIYFGLPLIVALVNSAVVVAFVFRLFDGLALASMISIIGISVALILAVYIIYFITTYVGSRRILKL